MRQLSLLVLLSLIFMAATCERSLELEFPEEPESLVIISNFTPDRDLQVQVSLSQPVLEEVQIEYVRNAQVKVFEGDRFIEQLRLVTPEVGTPFYTTQDFQPVIGIPYNIQVLVGGFEPVIATSTIPEQIELRNIEINNLIVERFPSTNQDRYSFDLDISVDDPLQEKNFYHLKVFQQLEKFTVLRNDTIIFETPIREIQFSPAQNDNYQVVHYEGGILLEDVPFDGEVKNISIPLQIDLASDEELPGQMIVELRTVSEEYYRFYAGISRQRLAPESPVSEPVIIFNNIENGLGVFAGYSQVADSVYIWKP